MQFLRATEIGNKEIRSKNEGKHRQAIVPKLGHAILQCHIIEANIKNDKNIKTN